MLVEFQTDILKKKNKKLTIFRFVSQPFGTMYVKETRHIVNWSFLVISNKFERISLNIVGDTVI